MTIELTAMLFLGFPLPEEFETERFRRAPETSEVEGPPTECGNIKLRRAASSVLVEWTGKLLASVVRASKKVKYLLN